MDDESMGWSAPCALFNTKDHLDVGGKPGVYRIRVFTDRNEPMKIRRVNGVDLLGILHIGKSKNLGLRIRTFRQAAEGLKAAHHAGCEFHEWGFKNIIPRNRLRYDYAITRTDQEALKMEGISTRNTGRHISTVHRLMALLAKLANNLFP